MPEHANKVDVIPVTSPEELLAKLESLPCDSVYEAPDDWVFRGVGWNGYGLLPAALRSDTPLTRAGITKKVRDRDGREAALAEASTLEQFLHAIQRSGLLVPGGGEVCQRTLTQLLMDDVPGPKLPYASVPPLSERPAWPNEVLLPLLALGQHHGLPTRLLDFTWDARIAAYFAAKDALKLKKSHFSVWAVHAAGVRMDGLLRTKIRQSGASTSDQGARVVFVDSAPNPRLGSQRGLFLLATEYCGPLPPAGEQRKWSPIEEIDVPGFDNQAPRRFDMHRCHARSLLAHLARLGVDAAAVYPDHAGAWQSVQERNMLAERKQRIYEVDQRRVLRDWQDSEGSSGD